MNFPTRRSWRLRARLDADPPPGEAYVFTTARNAFLDAWRRRRSEQRKRENAAAEPDAAAGTWCADAGAASPHRTTERNQLRTDLQAALERLPEDQRTVFLLSEVEGLKYEQIAEVMDIPAGTVASRKHHAARAPCAGNSRGWDMRCEECRALLRSLVDGRMDGRTRREMGLHLAECDECSALIEQERFWDDALLGYLDHELPPDLRSEILGDLADVETPATETISRLDRLDRRSRWRLMAWAATRDFADPMQWLRTAAGGGSGPAGGLVVDRRPPGWAATVHRAGADRAYRAGWDRPAIRRPPDRTPVAVRPDDLGGRR